MKAPRFLRCTVSLAIAAFALGTWAARTPAMSMSGMGSSSTTVSAKDEASLRASFLEFWRKAAKTAAFTPEQTKRLTETLETYAEKLAENYTALDGYEQQKKNGAAAQRGDLDKRIALKESERDLIVAQAEQALREFLSEEQVELLTVAAFHAVSESHAGDEHLGSVHGKMNSQMNGLEQSTMDLGEIAGKLNVNCKAVTLDIILQWLKDGAKG